MTKVWRCVFGGAAALSCAALPARADLTIASRPTHNLVSAAGVCTTHKPPAVPNAGDLATGNARYFSSGYGSVAQSYSTGAPRAGASSKIGGSIGGMTSPASAANLYWDTGTSGIANASQGVGNVADAPGVTAKTTAQLQSGLPAGFSSATWGQDVSINGGLPYLLALPPS